MTPAMRNAVAGGLTALGAWLLASLIYIVFLCQPHRAWVDRRAHRSEPILATGERLRRADDAIFTCETTHRTGPLEWHRDLDCYCAPADFSPSAIGVAVGGTCTVDHLQPTLSDTTGSCWFGRCNRYLNREKLESVKNSGG